MTVFCLTDYLFSYSAPTLRNHTNHNYHTKVATNERNMMKNFSRIAIEGGIDYDVVHPNPDDFKNVSSMIFAWCRDNAVYPWCITQVNPIHLKVIMSCQSDIDKLHEYAMSLVVESNAFPLSLS